MRLKLIIAYDGRPFNGWQVQPGGNTVQDHLHQALLEIAKQPIRVHGSGRTDTGVHALGQVAHFDAPADSRMQPANWLAALNANLPATVRIMACTEVAPDFHARFSASGKIYHYDICTEPVLPPHRAGLAWHLPRPLDPALLSAALRHVCGRHDFRAFAAFRGNETLETDYVRTIHAAEPAILTDGWRITFAGDGFLYKMVRLLVGAGVKVAQGKLPIADFAALFDQGPDLPHGKSPLCAPADGLYLREVLYPDAC